MKKTNPAPPRARPTPSKTAKTKTAKTDDARFILTQSQTAAALGVPKMSITQFMKRGMPTITATKLDLRETVPWRLQEIAKHHEHGRYAPSQMRARLATSQARRVELEIAKIRSQFVSAADMAQTYDLIAALLSAQLDGLGPRLAGELAGIDDPAIVAKRITAECAQIRASIADSLVRHADETTLEFEDTEADPAATDAAH